MGNDLQLPLTLSVADLQALRCVARVESKKADDRVTGLLIRDCVCALT